MSYKLGFATHEVETEATSLAITGAVPQWIDGSLIRTGPAKFNVGDEQFRHWFDGLAMLFRFNFASGAVSYTSRFLQSDAFAEASRTNHIASHEFGTNPRESFMQRLASILDYSATDNGNVNVTCVGPSFLALTETPRPVEFSPATLKTAGPFRFEDQLAGQTTTAHPHFTDGVHYNLLTHMGASSKYQLYALDHGSRKRRLIATANTAKPSYIHSFAVSERHLTLLLAPLLVNPLELIASGKPYIENYHWHKDIPMRLLVFDKNGSGLQYTFECESGFVFHTVNAFDTSTGIVLDVLMYEDASIVSALYLAHLRSEGTIPGAKLTRLELNFNSKKATREQLASGDMELPGINYSAFNGKPYRYMFAAGNGESGKWLDRLVKVDTHNGDTTFWHEKQCFPGEPVFVAAPDAKREDEGALLSVVLDATKQTSFLLVLDCKSMQEMARCHVPSVIGFNFHGQFFTGV